MDIAALAVELAAGHPDTGAYNADDALAAGELNAKNRPANVSIEDIMKFLILDNTHKMDDGTDTQDRSLWQRMKEVVAMSDTPDAAAANPWGASALGNITEIQQVKTHQLFEYFTLFAQGGLSVDLTDSNFKVYLAGAQAAGCMSESQETALLAMSNNLQSRAAEIGLGWVRPGNVKEARA